MKTFIEKHKILLIVIGIILIIAAGLTVKNKNLLGSFLGMGKEQGEVPTIKINYGNIAQVLSATSLVKELPKDTLLSLRFYNFNSGTRQWEKSYIIKKGEVKERNTENADITFTLHSKYLKQLTNKNFCSIIKQARANKDLGIETGISKAKLLWKFKGMLRYRKCLGF